MIKPYILFCIYLLISTQSQVIELTQQTFENYTTKNNYVFLYFYSPTDMKCILFQSQLDKLSQNFNQSVKFAKIDGTTNLTLSNQYGVNSYPALFFFDFTFVLPYRQNLSYSSLQNWLKQYLEDRVQKIKPQQLIDHQKPYIVIEYGAEYEIRVLNQSIHGIDIKGFSIGQGSNGKIKLYTRYEEFDYHGDIQRIQLRKWIKQHLQTIIIQLNTQQIMNKYYFHDEKPSLVIVLNSKDAKKQELYDILLTSCTKNKNKINCIEIKQKYPSHQGVHTYFEVQKQQSIIGFVKQKLNIAYLMSAPYSQLTQNSIDHFINGALQNTIQRLIDNVPSTTISFKQVKILEQQNINKVISNNKYIIVNYYKSNKQNCIEFARKYQIFAQNIKQEQQLSDVVVACFDCKKFSKQCQKRQIYHYPTLKFYINTIPIDYDKQLQIPDIQKFTFQKKSKTVNMLTNLNNIQNKPKPFLIFYSMSLTNEIIAYTAGLSIPCYYLQSNQNYIKLYLNDQIIEYHGEVNINKMQQWIKLQKKQRLINIMDDGQDQRISDAIHNYKYIFIFIDLNKNKNLLIKSKLGKICHSLQIAGGYVQSTHIMFPKFLELIQEEQPEQSKLIYYHLKEKRKQHYPYSLHSITKQSVQGFIADVQSGRIEQQYKKQDPTIQQL